MRALFLSILFLGSFNCSYSQYFNVFPNISDSVGTETFHYTIQGIGAFNDSVVLHVELVEATEELGLITSRVYDFTNPSADMTGYSTAENTSLFSIDLGDFPSGLYLLHMWVVIAGEVKNETFYKEP